MTNTTGQMPASLDPLLKSLYNAADRAWGGLSSFLTAQSILVLSWAAILTKDAPNRGLGLVLLVISVVGVFTAFQWAMLGTRMWHYQIEYAKGFRTLVNSFTVEQQGPGATIWRDVDAAVDAHWREGTDYVRLKWLSGNHWVLFTAPLALTLIHVAMFGVCVFGVIEWPVPQKDWPAPALFFGGLAVYLYALRGVIKICLPVLKKRAYAPV